jgi:hypothetical protein
MVRLRMIGRVSRKRLACVVALVVLGLLGGDMSALALTIGVAVLLAILAMSEAGWLRRGRGSDVADGVPGSAPRPEAHPSEA